MSHTDIYTLPQHVTFFVVYESSIQIQNATKVCEIAIQPFEICICTVSCLRSNMQKGSRNSFGIPIFLINGCTSFQLLWPITLEQIF